MNNILGSVPLDLHIEIHGNGYPIILLHGFGAILFTWRYLIDPLSRNYQLILFDLKGFGASPKPFDEKYSIVDQANLVYDVILITDLKYLTIIGHSLGGAIALQIAIKMINDMNRLDRLILIDSIAYRQKLPLFIDILRTPILGFIALNLIPIRQQARSILELAYFDRKKIFDEAIDAYSKPIESVGGRHALTQTAKQIIPDNVDAISTMYNTISSPTLIIWGKEDTIVPLKIGVRLNKAIKYSKLIIIDECGHNPHEEKPLDVVDAILKFLYNNI
jgi:pimeloyl-ACP methyl ester carboxylesterase